MARLRTRGSTTFTSYHKPHITDCFWTDSREKINNGGRSTTYSYEFAAPEHLSARRLSFVRGARGNTPCQRQVADGGCLLPRRQVVSVLCLANAAIATARRLARLSDKVVNITIRSQRLVVTPEVCASEKRNVAAARVRR